MACGAVGCQYTVQLHRGSRTGLMSVTVPGNAANHFTHGIGPWHQHVVQLSASWLGFSHQSQAHAQVTEATLFCRHAEQLRCQLRDATELTRHIKSLLQFKGMQNIAGFILDCMGLKACRKGCTAACHTSCSACVTRYIFDLQAYAHSANGIQEDTGFLDTA